MHKFDIQQRNGQLDFDYPKNQKIDLDYEGSEDEFEHHKNKNERAVNDKKVSLTKNQGFKKRVTEPKFENAVSVLQKR